MFTTMTAAIKKKMMDEPRYCVTCKWYFPGTPSDCRAPENVGVNLVTGEAIPGRYSAATNREFEVRGCTK